MKKTYIKPATAIVEMDIENSLMAASNLNYGNDILDRDEMVGSKPDAVGDVWGLDDDDEE